MEDHNKLEEVQSIVDDAEALNPTMKINPVDDNSDDIPFREMKAEIMELKPIVTKAYGNKLVIVLKELSNPDNIFEIFTNKTSISKLKKGFGDNSQEWIGKNIEVTKGVRLNKEMIVLTPII